MKKIINHKTYDTDKSIRLAKREEGEVTDRFNYFSQTLYRKQKTGEYFLHCQGGCYTPYNDEQIIPMSYDDAQEWAERYAPADIVAKEFGYDNGAEDVTEQINLTMPRSVVAKLDILSRKSSTPKSVLVANMIVNEFQKSE